MFFDSHPKGTSTSLGVGVNSGVGPCRSGVAVALTGGVGEELLDGVMVGLAEDEGVIDAVTLEVGVHPGVPV